MPIKIYLSLLLFSFTTHTTLLLSTTELQEYPLALLLQAENEEEFKKIYQQNKNLIDRDITRLINSPLIQKEKLELKRKIKSTEKRQLNRKQNLKKRQKNLKIMESTYLYIASDESGCSDNKCDEDDIQCKKNSIEVLKEGIKTCKKRIEEYENNLKMLEETLNACKDDLTKDYLKKIVKIMWVKEYIIDPFDHYSTMQSDLYPFLCIYICRKGYNNKAILTTFIQKGGMELLDNVEKNKSMFHHFPNQKSSSFDA